VAIRFYAALKKDSAIGNTFLEVAAGTIGEYAASLLGDVVNNHFIRCTNPDLVQGGSFVLELL
jgi:hypothetical protein